MGKRSVYLFLSVLLLMLSLSAGSSAQVTIPNIQVPNIPVPVIPTPFVPNIPTPFVPNIPTPFVPNIPTPFVPNIPDPLVPNIQTIQPNIPTIQPKIPTIQPNIPTKFVPNPVSSSQSDKPLREVDFRDFTDEPVSTPVPITGKEAYDDAMALFREEKYYSAWKAFTDSQYEDWQDWADKCPQEKPATGETWHASDQWLQDMELTIRVDQSPSSDMFFRIYKEGVLVSNVYISGSDEVTVKLPGNARYTIKDGVGRTWYGEKEAFGKTGSYETMTFDEKGTDTVYLQSGYAYTLSINVSEATGGTDVDSKGESWENFAE